MVTSVPALTVGGAYICDTAAGAGAKPMVNWDVVGENWRVVKQRARETWSTLSHKVSS